MAISTERLQQYFIAYYGRPGNNEGMQYWQAQNFSGEADLVWNFGNALQPEFQQLYGATSTSPSLFINAVFQNLFGRQAEPEGLNYWLGEYNKYIAQGLDADTVRGRMVTWIMDGAQDGAGGNDLTALNKKILLAVEYTNSLDTSEEILAYEGNLEAGRTFLSTVNADTDPATVDVDAAIQQMVDDAGTSGFTLTNGIDVATANVFNAPRGFTPGGTDQVNTLNDDDVLTGTGADSELNFTFVRDADIGGGANTIITPTLKNIDNVNVTFAGSAGNYTLDLQDSTGIDNILIERVANALTANVQNIAEATSNNVTVKNSLDPTNTINVTYLDTAVSGDTDSVNLTLNNARSNNVFRLEGFLQEEGFETLNLTSTGTQNSVLQFATKSLETATITGDAELIAGGSTVVTTDGTATGVEEARLYQAGFANVTGTLSKIDASGLNADLTLNLGAEVTATKAGTSGVQVDFQYIGTAQDDTVRLLAGLNEGDSIDLGAGVNRVAIMATAQKGSISNAGTLDVLGQTAAAQTIGVDSKIISGLESVYVRNEGNNGVNPGTPVAKVMTTNLLDLGATPAANVTVAHGTSGNGAVGSQVLQIDGAAGVSSVGVEIVDAVNNDPRFNFTLYTDSDLTLNPNGTVASGQNTPVSGANGVTGLTLNDSDTESNTVALTAQGYTAANALRADLGTSYTGTVSVTGTDAAEGDFFNLDAALNGFGIVQTGAEGNNTSVLAELARDTAFASVYENTNYSAGQEGVGYSFIGAGTGAGQRLIASTVNASTYQGDLIVRVGQADQTITTNTGNDTVIFDAINDNRAGLTIADKVQMGTGVDTIIIDGGFTATSETISLGASEWTNLKGVDVLRLGSNPTVGAGTNGYRLTITDQLVSQTDDTNHITIINNDGDLTAARANAATIDMRQTNGLSATKFVNFFGENGDTVTAGNVAAAPANRVILSDATANGGHSLNGGDNDLRAEFADTATWLAANQGNGNTIEYRNTAVVTEGDQAGIRNFDTIVFNNDQAVAQTLTLELTNTVLNALADASHTAAATQQEVMTIRANDGAVPAPLAGAALNIDGKTTGNAYVLNIRTDDNAGANNRDVADTINVNDNVGGTAGHTIDIADGGTAVDTLSFYGSTGDVWSPAAGAITVSGTSNTGTVTIQNSTGLATSTHTLSWDNNDVIRLTNDNGVTFTNMFAGTAALNFTGGAGNDTIVGTAGANTITGGAGADSITGGAGADTIVQGLADSVASTASVFAGATVAAADTITFGAGVDVINDFVAGAGGDVLDVLVAGAPTTLIGETVANLTGAQEVFFVSGAYNAVTGVFTIAADGAGADTAIVQADNGVAASDALTTNSSIVVLVGVDSDNLVAGNFA